MIIASNEVRQMAKKWRIMFRIKDNFMKLNIRNSAAEYGIELHEQYNDELTYFFIKDAESKASFERFLALIGVNANVPIGRFKERVLGVRVNCVTDDF